jgi:hypothetical protein
MGDPPRLGGLCPGCPCTPIVFGLGGEPLSALVSTGHVAFDLAGVGTQDWWTWVRPTTALLVWDPSHKGKIASGEQLLGSASFGQSWSDGYAALSSLDRNGDRRLTGAELEPLAAWFDRNSNGRGEPGEVVPLSDLAIESLAVDADGHDGEALRSSAGIVLRSGRTLPTYDWVSRTVSPLAGN